MSEIQRRALDALSKLPDGLQEKALIRLEATADAVEQIAGEIRENNDSEEVEEWKKSRA